MPGSPRASPRSPIGATTARCCGSCSRKSPGSTRSERYPHGGPMRSDEAAKSISAHALLFEEFLVREAEAGRLQLPLGPVAGKALVHGHCHQKSFGAFKPVEQVLRLVPDLDVETIESSCCGMAGAFGYGADTYQASMEMAELSLLPAVRRADDATLIVADGTSCRHQIKDGAGRGALHVARVLAMSLNNARSNPTASPVAKEPIHG